MDISPAPPLDPMIGCTPCDRPVRNIPETAMAVLRQQLILAKALESRVASLKKNYV